MIVVRISGHLESIGLTEALASAISSLYQDDRGDETFSGSAAGEALLLADANGAAMVSTDVIRTWISHMAESAHFQASPRAILEALATRLNDADHAAGRDAPRALTLGNDARDAIIQIIAKECDIDDAPIPQWVADLRAAQPAG